MNKIKLPPDIKAIVIGERIFLFRWNKFGWKQLSPQEEQKILEKYRND